MVGGVVLVVVVDGGAVVVTTGSGSGVSGRATSRSWTVWLQPAASKVIINPVIPQRFMPGWTYGRGPQFPCPRASFP